MSKKIATEILTFVSDEQKTFPHYFRFVSMLSLIFGKAMNKNLCQVFSDSEVCFFNLRKSDGRKNCARNFQIRKYTFFNI